MPGLLLGVALLAAACAAPALPAQGPPAQAVAAPATSAPAPPSRTTVRMGGLGGQIDSPLFVGQAEGYFAQQGLDLEISQFVTAAEMVPLMVTGRLDAGHGATGPAIFNAMLGGSNVKLVTDVAVLRDPSSGVKNMYWVIVRKDLFDSGQVRSVADLRGRKIGQPQGRPHIYMENTLRYHGLAVDDVEIVSTSFGEQLPALANGAVDAAWALEPFVSLGQNQGISVAIFDNGQATPNHPGQYLLYAPAFIDEHLETAQRFMVAYVQALRRLEDAWVKGINREEVIDLYIQNTSLKDRALYDQMGLIRYETNGVISVPALEAEQDFNLRHGFQRERLDPATFTDTRFGEHAVQVLGRYGS
jgi:NitT/TauT family transport system substrate-binding protein